MNKVKNAYSEVSTFLNLINREERDLIPNDILEKIDSYKDYNSLSFNNNGEIVLSEEAKSIILYLYETYILSDDKELKKAFNEKLKENDRIHKIIKDNQRDIKKDEILLNELFPKPEVKVEKEEEKQQETIEEVDNHPAKKEENFFTKILNFIRKIISK